MQAMNIQIDFRSGMPGYNQIAEQIQQEIASGRLQPGDQLPTVRALASDLRVNFNTVARAYRILDEIGIISTQHGRGTYILAQSSPEMTERLRRESLEALARRYLEETSRLGFEPQEALDQVREQMGSG
jgi:GntR family transcriptional regulator